MLRSYGIPQLKLSKYGRSVRISHAKAHATLKGTLSVYDSLPTELAQGMFAEPKTYDVLVRMAQAPGEFVDDSKVQTDRGMAVKVLGVAGATLENGSEGIRIGYLMWESNFLLPDRRSSCRHSNRTLNWHPSFLTRSKEQFQALRGQQTQCSKPSGPIQRSWRSTAILRSTRLPSHISRKLRTAMETM